MLGGRLARKQLQVLLSLDSLSLLSKLFLSLSSAPPLLSYLFSFPLPSISPAPFSSFPFSYFSSLPTKWWDMEFKFWPPLWVLGQVMTILRPVSFLTPRLPGDKTRWCICHASLQKRALFLMPHPFPPFSPSSPSMFPLLPLSFGDHRQVPTHIFNLVLILTYKIYTSK